MSRYYNKSFGDDSSSDDGYISFKPSRTTSYNRYYNSHRQGPGRDLNESQLQSLNNYHSRERDRQYSCHYQQYYRHYQPRHEREESSASDLSDEDDFDEDDFDEDDFDEDDFDEDDFDEDESEISFDDENVAKFTANCVNRQAIPLLYCLFARDKATKLYFVKIGTTNHSVDYRVSFIPTDERANIIGCTWCCKEDSYPDTTDPATNTTLSREQAAGTISTIEQDFLDICHTDYPHQAQKASQVFTWGGKTECVYVSHVQSETQRAFHAIVNRIDFLYQHHLVQTDYQNPTNCQQD